MEKKLLSATMKFNLACLNKLTEKEKAGWTGWDSEDYDGIFDSRIETLAKGELTQNNLVNISNYCMFLWNIKELRKEVK